MATKTHPLQSAIKYEVDVQERGWIELPVPFASGSRLTVFVIQEEQPEDLFSDLLVASASSTAFWDNPLDDEEWNDA